MHTIHLVDLQPIVTHGLEKVIAESNNGYTCRSFNTIQSFLKDTKSNCPDIVIIDACFPDRCSIEVIRALKEVHPHVKVIFFTLHAQTWRIREIIKLKANGLVLKTSPVIEINNALKALAIGKNYFCPKTKDIIVNISSQNDIVLLTQRERQVLRLIAMGQTSLSIASELCISENTIETHRRSLFQKFHVKNSTNLLSKAFDQGYLDV